MAQRIYEGIDNVARNTIRAYGGIDNKARTLVRGYLGDAEGVARQFWGALGYVIFDNGEWHYVPQGFDFENNFADTSTSVADLSAYYLTEKLLWVHATRAIPMPQWTVNQDKYIDSNYDDYNEQIILNAIYIPIERIYNPSKLRIIGKGNMFFTACRVNANVMTRNNGYKIICSEDLTVKELDISDNPYIDYIEIYAPDTYESTNENVVNPHVYQPIPFVVTNRIYSNNSSAYNLPGMEINQISGGRLYCFLKYREPDNSNQCVYMMSTEPFSVQVTYRFYNQPTYETWNSELIQSNPPIYKIVREGYWWNYKFQNIPQWHTGYYGGWNTYYDIDVGNIVLYGRLNVLPTPTGVQNSLQLIKRIEVIGGEIPNNNE